MNQRLLNAFLTTTSILAVAVFGAGMNGGISVGASNHVGILPVVRRILNPQYLPNDFNIGLRFYHHRTFAYLIAGLASLFGENLAIVILHSIGIVFCISALYLVCRMFELSRFSFIVVGAMLATGFAWTGLGLEENDFLGNPEIQPPLFAHGFVLMAIWALGQSRYRLGAAFIGCVVLFHLQIGVIATLMFLPLYLLQIRTMSFRELAKCCVVFAFPAAPALLHLLAMIKRGLLQPVAQMHSLASYIEFRHPHHFALMSWQHALWIGLHVAILIGTYLWAKKREVAHQSKFFQLVCYALALIVLFAFHFTDYYLIKQDKFANLQSIRLSPLLSVLGAIILVWWIQQLRFHRWLMPVLLVLTLAWGYRVAHLPESETDFAVRIYSDESDKRGLKKDWVNICNWVRENGAQNTIYLTPPANDGFTAISHRSNVAEFKINPDGALHMNEWFERLSDLTGGRLPQEKGFDNRKLLNQAYNEMSADQFWRLSQKYQARFAIVARNAKLPFPVLYENKNLKLVALAASN